MTGGTTTSVAHAFTNANDGSITLADAIAGTINYTGLEPITDNLIATDRSFTFNGGAETITVTDGTASDGMTRIDSTLGESVDFANPTGSLTINAGSGDDTVTTTSVDAAYHVDLTINGDANTDTVNLNADITFASGESLIVNAESLNTGAGADLTTSGAGVITVTANDVALDASSTLVSASTVTLQPQTTSRAINLGTNTAGSLSLTDAELDRVTAGTVQIGDVNSGAITVSAAITQGNNLSLTTGAGIDVDNAITMAADKSLTANALGTTNGAINLTYDSSNLSATGTGAISLTTSRNISLANGASITTVDGNLSLQANLQVTPTTGYFFGIDLFGGLIQVTGTGAVTVQGKGGDDAAGSQYGVLVQGDIIGGASGLLTVLGTGGASSRTDNTDVVVGSSSITSSGGNVSVTGTEGGGSTGIAINVTTSGMITTAANGGTLTLIGDSMRFLISTTISASTSSSVTLRQRTNGVGIDLGADTDPNGGPLSLSDAELDRVTAGCIVVGDANTGVVTFSAAIDRANSDTLEIITGDGITQNFVGTAFSGETLILNGDLAPALTSTGTFGVDGTVTLDATASYEVNLNGTANFDQMIVSGNSRITTLNVADLVITLDTVLAVGSQEVFRIVDSIGIGSTVSSTFKFGGTTLNDGDTFTVGSTIFRINYNPAGAAGDVILTEAGNTPPVVDLDGAGGTNNFTAAFVEYAGAVNITDVDATISDAENGVLTNLKLVVSANPDGAAESIGSGATVTEGGSASTIAATLHVTTDGVAGGSATLASEVTADLSGNGDYSSAYASFLAGAGNNATSNITVSASQDTLVEGAESFANQTLLVTGPATVSGSGQTITVNDDDIAYSIGTNIAIVSESTAPQTVTFTISRSGATTVASTVKFAITGTAARGADYANTIGGTGGATGLTGTINFAIGQSSKTITVIVLDDSLVEFSETILTTLSNAAGPATGTITISTAAATTTITDNEPPTIAPDGSGYQGDTQAGVLQRRVHCDVVMGL